MLDPFLPPGIITLTPFVRPRARSHSARLLHAGSWRIDADNGVGVRVRSWTLRAVKTPAPTPRDSADQAGVVVERLFFAAVEPSVKASNAADSRPTIAQRSCLDAARQASARRSARRFCVRTRGSRRCSRRLFVIDARAAPRPTTARLFRLRPTRVEFFEPVCPTPSHRHSRCATNARGRGSPCTTAIVIEAEIEDRQHLVPRSRAHVVVVTRSCVPTGFWGRNTVSVRAVARVVAVADRYHRSPTTRSPNASGWYGRDPRSRAPAPRTSRSWPPAR